MTTQSYSTGASGNADGRASDFYELLTLARQGDSESTGRLLLWYGNYLSILASTQLDRRLRRRINPSDVVQEAMLAAHRDFADFRGHSEGELLCWLRTIVIHTLHQAYSAHLNVAKRDIRREVSIDEMSNRMEESATNLAAAIPSDIESPSSPMQNRERGVEFANRLSDLRPQYRQVIIYRLVEDLSFDQIAARMNRSEGAVRMLWLRALESYRVRGGER